jgi:hypothetical protein
LIESGNYSDGDIIRNRVECDYFVDEALVRLMMHALWSWRDVLPTGFATKQNTDAIGSPLSTITFPFSLTRI